MNKRDIAGYLGINRTTLYNWKKNKPNLYKTVMKGLAFDEFVEKTLKNADELKKLNESFGKIPPQYLKKD